MACPIRRRILRTALALISCNSFVPCLLMATASPPRARVLEVKIVATMEFKSSRMWQVEMLKMVRNISQGFKSRFGLAFKVKEWDFWHSDSDCRSLYALLRDLVMKVPRGGSHLVIGIVPSTISDGPPFGVADYLNAYVLIKDHSAKSGLTRVLEHEICHIFGAIDLDEKGSIMGFDRRCGRYDDFTKRIIALNRERRFTDGVFPLPPEMLEKAIALYRSRLSTDNDDAGFRKEEEADIRTVLSHLYRETYRKFLF